MFIDQTDVSICVSRKYWFIWNQIGFFLVRGYTHDVRLSKTYIENIFFLFNWTRTYEMWDSFNWAPHAQLYLWEKLPHHSNSYGCICCVYIMYMHTKHSFDWFFVYYYFIFPRRIPYIDTVWVYKKIGYPKIFYFGKCFTCWRKQIIHFTFFHLTFFLIQNK